VSRPEHLVHLLLFEVIGDVLHALPKLSAITVVILNRVSFKIAV
jgi:hypothetical protein